MKKTIKIVAISDTHSNHDQLDIPECDLLIHSGDFVFSHNREEMLYPDATENFCNWFKSLKQAKRKIAVPGNHDFICQKNEDWVRDKLGADVDLLIEQGVQIDGWNIWGTPWQPNFYNWAFNTLNDNQMKEKINLVPKDTDILITHHPPHGILDKSSWGTTCGCPITLSHIKENLKIKLHIFGHIHPGYGMKQIDDTVFCNATVVNEKYKIVNKPVIIYLSPE